MTRSKEDIKKRVKADADIYDRLWGVKKTKSAGKTKARKSGGKSGR